MQGRAHGESKVTEKDGPRSSLGKMVRWLWRKQAGQKSTFGIMSRRPKGKIEVENPSGLACAVFGLNLVLSGFRGWIFGCLMARRFSLTVVILCHRMKELSVRS